MIYLHPSCERSNENEIQNKIQERKESEKVKEIPSPLHSQPTLPSPCHHENHTTQPQRSNNETMFTLICTRDTTDNKTYGGMSVSRTEKHSFDPSHKPSKYCNNKHLQITKTGEIRQERERGTEGDHMMENKKYGQEKEIVHKESENDKNDEGWSTTSARLLHPLPYQPNSMQRYKCNIKTSIDRDYYNRIG